MVIITAPTIGDQDIECFLLALISSFPISTTLPCHKGHSGNHSYYQSDNQDNDASFFHNCV
jgi:hypothetical protein